MLVCSPDTWTHDAMALMEVSHCQRRHDGMMLRESDDDSEPEVSWRSEADEAMCDEEVRHISGEKRMYDASCLASPTTPVDWLSPRQELQFTALRIDQAQSCSSHSSKASLRETTAVARPSSNGFIPYGCASLRLCTGQWHPVNPPV